MKHPFVKLTLPPNVQIRLYLSSFCSLGNQPVRWTEAESFSSKSSVPG